MLHVVASGLAVSIFGVLLSLLCGCRSFFVYFVQMCCVVLIGSFTKAFHDLDPIWFLPGFAALWLIWLYARTSRRIQNSHGFGTMLYAATFYPSETKIVYLCFLGLPVLPVRALIVGNSNKSVFEYHGWGMVIHWSNTTLGSFKPMPLFPPSIKCIAMCGLSWIILLAIALTIAKYGGALQHAVRLNLNS